MKFISVATVTSMLAVAIVAQGQTSQTEHQASPQAQAVQSACQGEIQSLCPGKSGQEAMSCLRSNASANSNKVSANCKSALQQLPQQRQERRPR